MSNPYAPPAEAKPSPGPEKIDVMAAFKAVFDTPDYMMNIVLVAVFAFIPVINQVLLLGYQFEIVEHLHRNRGGQIPTLSFDKFTHYLIRGLWPFIVNMLLGMVFGMVFGVFYFIGLGIVFAVAGALGEDAAGIVIGLGFFVFFIFYFLMIVGLIVGMFPFMLRAGLAQDFGAAFDFDFAKHFYKTVGVKFGVAMLLFSLLGSVLALLGMAVCCIGMFAAIPVIMMAQAHLFWQTYEVYLAQGGQPIPLKEPDTY